MSVVELRTAVDRYLDQVDESFLRVIHAMLDAQVREQRKGGELPPPPWAKPRTQEQLVADLMEADAQIDRGEYITLDELKSGKRT